MMSHVVYIITNKRHGTLYIGVTNNLKRRIIEHKFGAIKGFTQKYDLKILVYFEQFDYIKNAIYREKQLKRWHRDWKINLIEEQNPMWHDLYEKTFGEIDNEYKNYILKRIENNRLSFSE
jgi:putative endonuclease